MVLLNCAEISPAKLGLEDCYQGLAISERRIPTVINKLFTLSGWQPLAEYCLILHGGIIILYLVWGREITAHSSTGSYT